MDETQPTRFAALNRHDSSHWLLGVSARLQTQAWLLPLLAIVVGLVAFSLRAFHLGSSYDIFIDEVTYLRIGQSIAANGQVKLYGQTFYLHPPAFFVIEAAYLRLLPATTTMIDLIYRVRYLNAIFAGLTAILIFLIGQRIGGWFAGAGAATLFALDALIVKMNSYILLDTSAMFWIVLGYWLLLSALHDERHAKPLSQSLAVCWLLAALHRRRTARLLWQSLALIGTVGAKLFGDQGRGVGLAEIQRGQSLSRWRSIGVGLMFGLALLTKDMTAFLSLLPLGACFVFNRLLARSTAALIGSTTLLTYLIYPLTVVAVGDWDRFAEQKLAGFLRLVGVHKITGVGRHGGPTLLETIIARLDQFGTTYTLITFGVIAMVLLLASGGTPARLLAVWTASAYVLLAYCVLFGTLEEQFFYFLVLPCLLAISTSAELVFKERMIRRHATRMLRGVVLGFGVLTVWSSVQWFQTHSTPDNGYEQTITYIRQYLAPTAQVAATSETAQFLLDDYRSAPFGSWYQLDELRAAAPDYVLITPHTLAWNHGDKAIPLLNWINRHGEPVFTFRGKGDNVLVLYRLPNDALPLP